MLFHMQCRRIVWIFSFLLLGIYASIERPTNMCESCGVEALPLPVPGNVDIRKYCSCIFTPGHLEAFRKLQDSIDLEVDLPRYLLAYVEVALLRNREGESLFCVGNHAHISALIKNCITTLRSSGRRKANIASIITTARRISSAFSNWPGLAPKDRINEQEDAKHEIPHIINPPVLIYLARNFCLTKECDTICLHIIECIKLILPRMEPFFNRYIEYYNVLDQSMEGGSLGIVLVGIFIDLFENFVDRCADTELPSALKAKCGKVPHSAGESHFNAFSLFKSSSAGLENPVSEGRATFETGATESSIADNHSASFATLLILLARPEELYSRELIMI